MNKDEIRSFLMNNLNLPETLKQAVVDCCMEAYIEEHELQSWEQLRFIKQKLDSIWREVKICSERKLVREKLDQMIKSFPRPKNIHKKT